MKNYEKLKHIINASQICEDQKADALATVEFLLKEKTKNEFLIKRLQYDKTTTQRFLNKTVEELEKTNKSIVDKNTELEQFNYIASHDMQEPLRTISSLVNLLHSKNMKQLDATGQKSLTYIKDSTERMSNLITSLLQYSRIGHSGMPQHISIDDVVDEIKRDLKSNSAENNVTLTYNKLPIVFGFRTELKLLFQNLISNGIKFKKENIAPKIEITSNKKPSYFQFQIRDNGIGIKPEYSNKIFKIFQRLHTYSRYPGTGIGLSHCKKIVELHKGKIWFESEYNVGTSFFFEINNDINEYKNENN